MKKGHKELYRKGQSFIEYVLLIGVIVMVLLAMTPLLKRGTQSMIKVVADQIGNQQNSEQLFNSNVGILEQSYTSARTDVANVKQDQVGIFSSSYSETVSTTSNALLNLGFSELPGR